MVELVTRMMDLKKRQARAPLPVRARTQTGKNKAPAPVNSSTRSSPSRMGRWLTANG
jgi:hypothetical protein